MNDDQLKAFQAREVGDSALSGPCSARLFRPTMCLESSGALNFTPEALAGNFLGKNHEMGTIRRIAGANKGVNLPAN